MYEQLLKKIYYLLPFKREFYLLLRSVYTPSNAMAKYLKFKGVFTKKFKEYKIKMFSNHTTLEALIFWRGFYSFEPFSMKVWSILTLESQVIMDIGANTGVYSIISAMLNPDAVIYSFEPIERIYHILLKNIKLNRKEKQIYPYNQAVYSKTEESMIFYDMESFDNQIGSFKKEHVLKHRHAKKLKPVSVNAISIDDFANLNSLKTIDLIKIDVEGVEDKVLEGMRKVISEFRPVILCEISDNQTAFKLNQLLANKNYIFYDIFESGKIIERQIIEKTNLNYLFIPQEKKYLIDKI